MTWQEFKDEVERQLHNLDLNERVEIRYIDVPSFALMEYDGENIEVEEEDDGTITIE